MLFTDGQLFFLGLIAVTIVYIIVRYFDKHPSPPECQHKWETTQIIEKEIFRQGIMIKQHTYVQTCRECGKVKGTILP